MMILENKVAVIYGARGAIGGAVARAMAREGARVYGTSREEVDALDEAAIDRHLDAVMAETGKIDISFNAIGLPEVEVVGSPLTEIDAAMFERPIAAYVTSYFLTARLAARRMLPQRSGVIMTVTALPSRQGTPLNGGYGPSQAAKEALTRDLSAELAPHGIRVVGLRAHALPYSSTIAEVHALKAKATGLSLEQFQDRLIGSTHPRRALTAEEVANVAVFLASDAATPLTGTAVNLSMGALAD
jgi:NAD(P)-dependent dehydrogenase (short-subunit alcohol dehydrogenase family)